MAQALEAMIDSCAATDLDTLFGRLAQGDLEALGAIYDASADELYGLALWRCGSASDAEDAVQEAFVRLARRPARLRRVRDARAYLLTVVRRAACDLLRRRRPAEPLDAELVEPSPQEPARAADARTASRALLRLPAGQREALYLRTYAGLSYAEIGRLTGVPTFTAASRCRLAVAKLRRWMGVDDAG